MNESAGLGAAIVIRSKPTTHRRHPMDNLPKALTALAALALLAIASVFTSGNASTVGRS